MTMHLVRGMTSLNTKKRKKKMSEKRLKEIEFEWRKYNKDMRRKNMHSLQFDKLDDYISYVSGNLKPRKKEFVPYEPPKSTSRQNSKPVETKSAVHGIPTGGTRKEPQVYTGDYIVGIATMHKSNLVPVTREQDPVEYATMRRN